jgi:Pectate lyase superfamily protein
MRRKVIIVAICLDALLVASICSEPVMAWGRVHLFNMRHAVAHRSTHRTQSHTFSVAKVWRQGKPRPLPTVAPAPTSNPSPTLTPTTPSTPSDPVSPSTPSPSPSASATLSGTPTATPTPTTTPAPTPTPTQTATVPGLPVNVKDYGAIGDGTTDDTVALNKAAAAATATGVRLHVPAGVYKVTNWTPPAGLSVVGDGVASQIRGMTLWTSDQTFEALLMGASNVDHAAFPQAVGTVHPHKAYNVLFKNVRFRGIGPVFNVSTEGTFDLRYITFTNCEFEAPNMGYSEAAQCVSWFIDFSNGSIADHITFSGCHFGAKNPQGRTGSAYGGIVAWGTWDAGTSPGPGYFDNWVIENCTFEAMDVWGIDLFAVQDNNPSFASKKYLPSNYAHCRAAIRGNLFKGAGAAHAGDTYYYNICTEPLFNSVIEDNTFWQSAYASIKMTKNSRGCVVRDNVFDHAVSNGVVPIGDYKTQRIVRFYDGGGNTGYGNTLVLPSGLTQTANGWIAVQDGSSTAYGNRVLNK